MTYKDSFHIIHTKLALLKMPLFASHVVKVLVDHIAAASAKHKHMTFFKHLYVIYSELSKAPELAIFLLGFLIVIVIIFEYHDMILRGLRNRTLFSDCRLSPRGAL